MHLRSSKLVIIAVAGIGLCFAAQPAKAGYLNLTGSLSTGSIATDSSVGTAIFTEGPVGSGTGIFPAFVVLQRNGSEHGYNTTANVFDNHGSDQHNHALLYSSLAVVTVNGNDYFQFSLDVNEVNNGTDNYISLDSLKIFTSSVENPNTTTVANLGTLRYDMGAGNGVALDYNNEAGSGKADLTVLIPVFQPGAGELYVYLYSALGGLGVNPAGLPAGDYGSSDGPEEWGAKLGAQTNVVPAPAGLILLATAVPVLALRRVIRRKQTA